MRKAKSRKSRLLVGAVVAERRKRARLSQRKLARKLGRSPSWISRIEAGRASVELFEFVHIAGVLGFDPIRALRRISKDLEG